MIDTLLKVGGFLMQHGDIIDDLITLLENADAKPLLKDAIKAIKVQMSDAIMREEFSGVKGNP